MALKILLSSTLRKYYPDYEPIKGVDFSADGKTTIAEVCREIGIPMEKIKVIMVNGKSASPDYVVKGDERIGLFPPVGGG